MSAVCAASCWRLGVLKLRSCSGEDVGWSGGALSGAGDWPPTLMGVAGSMLHPERRAERSVGDCARPHPGYAGVRPATVSADVVSLDQRFLEPMPVVDTRYFARMRPPGHSEVNGSIDRSTTSAERLSAEHHFAVIASVYELLRDTDDEPVCHIRDPLPDGPLVGVDVGAGTGRYTELLAKLLADRASVLAADRSLPMLLVHRGRSGNAPPRAVRLSACLSGPARSTSSRRSTRCTTSISTGLSRKSRECWLRAAICSSTPAHRSRTPGRSGPSVPRIHVPRAPPVRRGNLASLTAAAGRSGHEIVQLLPPGQTRQARRAGQGSRLLHVRPLRAR